LPALGKPRRWVSFALRGGTTQNRILMNPDGATGGEEALEHAGQERACAEFPNAADRKGRADRRRPLLLLRLNKRRGRGKFAKGTFRSRFFGGGDSGDTWRASVRPARGKAIPGSPPVPPVAEISYRGSCRTGPARIQRLYNLGGRPAITARALQHGRGLGGAAGCPRADCIRSFRLRLYRGAFGRWGGVAT